MGHSYMTTPRESEDLMREVILLAACSAGEVLPQTPDLPADVFTACLTTPIKVPSRCIRHQSSLTVVPNDEQDCMPCQVHWS